MLTLGAELFRFENKTEWIDKGQFRYRKCGLKKGDYIAVDTVGRVCIIGKHFTRANNDESFPVIVYKISV